MLHLMNHTAGFAEQLFDLRYQENDMEQSLEDVLSINQPEQVFEPGTVSAYSNWGAALAALIVERVSGQDFAEYVHEHRDRDKFYKRRQVIPFAKEAGAKRNGL